MPWPIWHSSIPKLLDLNYPMVFHSQQKIQTCNCPGPNSAGSITRQLAKLVISDDFACCSLSVRGIPHGSWSLKWLETQNLKCNKHKTLVGSSTKHPWSHISPKPLRLKLISFSRGTNLTIGGSWLHSQPILRAWNANPWRVPFILSEKWQALNEVQIHCALNINVKSRGGGIVRLNLWQLHAPVCSCSIRLWNCFEGLGPKKKVHTCNTSFPQSLSILISNA